MSRKSRKSRHTKLAVRADHAVGDADAVAGRDALDQVGGRGALDVDVELGLGDGHAADGRCSNGSWVERTLWTSTTYRREVGGLYGNGSPV